MAHQLSIIPQTSFVRLQLSETIDEPALHPIFESASKLIATTEGACGLLIDCAQVQSIGPETFSRSLKVFDRMLPILKGNAPVFYAMIGDGAAVETILRLAEQLGINCPGFKSDAEAISYLNLKVDSTYKRQTKMLVETDELEDTLLLPERDRAAIGEAPPDPEFPNIFPEGGVLRIEHVQTSKSLLVFPREEMTIGREDASLGKPDIDLTTWGGYYSGVSRRHAILFLDPDHTLSLVDLDTINGTQVNGVLIKPHHKAKLSHRDTIRLGRLTVRIFFQTTMERQ